MVKILDVEEPRGAGSDDDDCCEIGMEEFTKKLNLKEGDDVILVAAKGKIVKVEVDQPEDLTNASDANGSSVVDPASSPSRRPVETDDKVKRVAAGACVVDSPFIKIDGDENSILVQVEIDEDRFAIDKPSAKFQAEDGKDDRELFRGTVGVVPSELVVKRERAAGDGSGDGAGEGSCLGRAPERRIFDEDDEEDVVVVDCLMR
ncbi:hypothetical protein BS78_01G277600 [Paspalum vaginatum]|nr:hypothetical protein BS78_01G277600 [Paspalum vaginatum]